MGKVIKLTEGKLNEMVTSVINEMFGENINSEEFTFGDSKEMKPGIHQQQIFYNNELVGFLNTREKNPLAPLEEYYHIPDVDAGIDEQGFIDFKIFKDDDESALAYTKANFDQIVYLIKNADWD